MKKLIIMFVMAAIIEFAFVGVCQAADPNMPKFDPNAIRGRVLVEKDANSIITAVKLENRRRGNWNIVLDEKGKELAETMANKIVTITGTEETKDGVKWLTVETFTELKRSEGRRGHGDPNQFRRRPSAPGK